ncbi:hypothetical protein GCM10008107_18790 [Psychrosphaera saromensis]|uniref:Heme biosynthesis operon protein HemX n=1 Tax=Psychrosphaera saromensis TaxID=716813 RepID=A0A2S7URM0_9GAMM|nr:uroporphyrinogen-III C-methyltransferase [Psychrosphaera saromensis]PQJ52593.1 hypothetical protein BTO11_02285 [Psychrosphaera saromensis]GHB69694.1 hypothetical protein GCM10008107_18790 [Psychrosphaera saromensis]GLQ13064.1 hypothetical protein GCM10007917_05190 [Psychrosphaera saromensis]
MAQDKESKTSKTSNELTPQGENEVVDAKNSTAAKQDDSLSTQESLAKLESEVKQSRAAEKETKSKNTASSKAKASKTAEAKSTETSSSANSSKNAEKKIRTEKTKKPRSWLAIFAFIFSVAVSAFVGFFWWQSQLWFKNQEQLEQLKQQSIVNTQQMLNQLQTKLTQLEVMSEQKLNQTEDDTKQINDSLSSLAVRIKELGKSQPNYWLAAEAGYLINLAERRLLVEQDANTAIQLLLDANQRLTAMQDPSVFHIREALSEDIASLYSIKQPDSDSVYLALSGLIEETKTIKFAQVYIPKPNANVTKEQHVSSEVNDWSDNLLISVRRFFGNFITITRRDAAIQPQLPADQKWFVRSNLTTQMLMAQNAVVDKNQAIYDDALKKIEDWILQYFDASDTRVAAVTMTLIELKQKDIGLVLPEELNAQPLIANYLQKQISLREKVSEDDQGQGKDK